MMAEYVAGIVTRNMFSFGRRTSYTTSIWKTEDMGER
jgi:hypothetical protein